MRIPVLAGLLSFNAGFVDTTGFVGLQGLFVAHVTGNFVTLAAALISGTHGVLAKLLVLPAFLVMVALAHVAGNLLRRWNLPALRPLLAAKAVLLLAFFGLAVRLGPFPDSDAPAALLTGFAGVAAMAVQNAVQRVHLGAAPPTTLMTGNVTQLVLDAVDLARQAPPDRALAVRVRARHILTGVLCFAAGCGVAAGLFAWVGFWGLAVPVAVAAVTAAARVAA